MKKAGNEKPRIGVFVCHCGANIGGVVNVPEVAEYAKTLQDVVYSEKNLYTCSSNGLNSIKEAIKKFNLNRVVVAACTPRTHEPLFRMACEEAGLNRYLFEMVNIRDQCSWVHMNESDRATEKAKDLVRMGVARSRLLKPQRELEIEVKPSALIIGGGIAGMTAAISLSNQNFKTYIVEKESELGGLLRKLYKVYPFNLDASKVLEEVVGSIKRDENIELFTSSFVKSVKGFIGNFEVDVQKKNRGVITLQVGTIIVALGAVGFEPIGMYGYGEYENVVTQIQLEGLLRRRRLKKPEKVVMIQCVGAREEEGTTYCSRICCMVALKNAMEIKELYPETEIYILYRDLQTYGVRNEQYLKRAREKGVKFIRYDSENPPNVEARADGKLGVSVHQELIGEVFDVDCDLVVLSTPLIPSEDAKEVSSLLKVPLGSDGFFFESHSKLRPVDFSKDGIYLCGAAHSPKSVEESVSQALAAASRAAIPMTLRNIKKEAITAVVDEKRCIGCEFCVDICGYRAPILEKRKAKIIEVMCKGCGLCAASCPRNAITMKHFTDEQIMAEVRTAFGVI
jgi:heterodisulfide reductase subunit A